MRTSVVRAAILAVILIAALPAAYALHVAAQDGFLRWAWPVEVAALAEIGALAIVVAGVQAGWSLVTGRWRWR